MCCGGTGGRASDGETCVQGVGCVGIVEFGGAGSRERCAGDKTKNSYILYRQHFKT